MRGLTRRHRRHRRDLAQPLTLRGHLGERDHPALHLSVADLLPGNRHITHGHFWSPSDLAASCGGASLSIIQQYIEQQKAPVSQAPSFRAYPALKDGACTRPSRSMRIRINDYVAGNDSPVII